MSKTGHCKCPIVAPLDYPRLHVPFCLMTICSVLVTSYTISLFETSTPSRPHLAEKNNIWKIIPYSFFPSGPYPSTLERMTTYRVMKLHFVFIRFTHLGITACRAGGPGCPSSCGDCSIYCVLGLCADCCPNKENASSNIACMRRRVSFMSISDSSLDTLDADSVDLFAFFPSSY